MRKISFQLSLILITTFAGCSHSPQSKSNIRSLITIPIESIKSNGSIVSQSLSKDKVDLLEKKLDEIKLTTQVKGISATVGVPNEGIWYATRGITGNGMITKITPDLKFCAGSICKIFTAVVVLSLEDEGRLHLGSSIDKWLPEMHHAAHITINHLLTHTSGIATFDSVKEYEANKYRYRNPKEVLSYLKNKELLFKPGQHFAYSNIGYLMLGIIIEKVTGKSYEEAVKQYIIDKINLKETDVMTDQNLKSLVVRGHHNGNVLSKTEDYIIPFAAGSILATPKDLNIFFQALMSGRLLSQHSLQIMFSDMNLMSVTQNTYYGKGIVVAASTPIGDIIGHRGGIKGFGSALYYHPKENFFICVMMNDDTKSPDPAVFRLMEVMMEE
ncbi:MAG: serine hydrolase domain-containing protein [Spirochaetota bacterium]|nr:serine hydrolase domain-containing protein [Spirochaetota bacterium]